MSRLFKSDMVCLYAISEDLDGHGLYPLKPFEFEELNKVFDRKNLESELNNVCNCLYGSGQCFEIVEETYGDDGKIYVPIDSENDDEIVVHDITEKINCTPDDSTIYLAVNGNCTEYQWIVLESVNTIYTDSE